MSAERQIPQRDVAKDSALTLAFSLGWACADPAHLPVLPEAISRVLSVPGVKMTISRRDGTTFIEHAHPVSPHRDLDVVTAHEVGADLGTKYQLRLCIKALAALSKEQAATLAAVLRLVRSALESILVWQNQREILGMPFNELSDREWQICLAMETPDGEKHIAAAMDCSRHTVHSCVKSLYRKMRVKSRLQMLDQLKAARDRMHCQALARFRDATPAAASFQTTDGPVDVNSEPLQ